MRLSNLKPVLVPLLVGVGSGFATVTFRYLATADSLNDGRAVLVTLNAVASGLTYALMWSLPTTMPG